MKRKDQALSLPNLKSPSFENLFLIVFPFFYESGGSMSSCLVCLPFKRSNLHSSVSAPSASLPNAGPLSCPLFLFVNCCKAPCCCDLRKRCAFSVLLICVRGQCMRSTMENCVGCIMSKL